MAPKRIITSLPTVKIINRKLFKLSVKDLQCPVVCVEPINSANLLCVVTAVSEGHVGKQSSVTKTSKSLALCDSD